MLRKSIHFKVKHTYASYACSSFTEFELIPCYSSIAFIILRENKMIIVLNSKISSLISYVIMMEMSLIVLMGK